MTTTTRHGTYPGYKDGCRNRCCKNAAARYQNQRMLDWYAGKPRLIDPTGTRRRLRALTALGWPMTEVAVRLGITVRVVEQYRSNRRSMIRRANAERIAAVYNELSGTPGPSRRARILALSYGWSPPHAWDDGTIDDPNSTPAQAWQANGRLHLEDVEHLAAAGETFTNTARRLGARPETLERFLHRRGRGDLVTTLKTRNATT